MRKLNIPQAVAVLVASAGAAAAADPMPEFVEEARAAGCGCGGAGCDTCGTFPPGKGKPPPVPMVINGTNGDRNAMYYEPGGSGLPRDWKGLPCDPYVNPAYDAQYMTRVVGTATIAAGASAEINVEPTQGYFDAFYMTIIAVDNANPNNRGRVEVGRWFVGDCPGDCRSTAIFSDVYDGTGQNGCCVGVPFRARFGRSNNGEQLRATITNPAGGFANARVQIIATGVCHRGTCAC